MKHSITDSITVIKVKLYVKDRAGSKQQRCQSKNHKCVSHSSSVTHMHHWVLCAVP